MPRNRNKYRRQSLTEVRVNRQDIRISPYLAQYTAKGKGEAEHVRQMTELVCVTRPVPEIADQVIALHQGKECIKDALILQRQNQESYKRGHWVSPCV